MKVAPTELQHAPFRALTKKGKGDGSIERQWGVDFYFSHEDRHYGVQRKEVKDLVASANDKRLAQEIALMQHLDAGMLIVEGKLQWSLDGTLMVGGYSKNNLYTMARHLSLMFSVQAKGIWLMHSADTKATAGVIRAFEAWVKKGEHKSLESTRMGAKSILPGETREVINQRHVLCGLPHMGPERAMAWIKHFGGTGLVWEIGMDDMMEVPGIGKGIAEDLMEAI